MDRFQNRTSFRRFLHSRPAAAVFAVLVFLLGWSAVKSYLGVRSAGRVYQEVKAEREELVLEKNRLADRLSYISSPYGLEKELRRKFNFILPGEELLVVVDRPQVISEEGSSGGALWPRFIDFMSGLFKFGE